MRSGDTNYLKLLENKPKNTLMLWSRSGYKYQLVDAYPVKVGVIPEEDVHTVYIRNHYEME